MPTYTFRTEGPFDGERERAEALIAEMGLGIMKHWTEADSINSDWLMDFFTVESDIQDIEDLREEMEKVISNDKRFVDLHRCSQTLVAGNL